MILQPEQQGGHSSWVRAVAYSSDGAHVASGSDDNTVRLWEVATAAKTARFEGRTDWVHAVAFSPYSKHVASASEESTAHLWEVATEPGVLVDDVAMPSPAQADTTTAGCLIHNPAGIAEPDAQTAALLVCQALRRTGVDVGEPVYEVPDTASVYRVGVHFLGEAVLLRVSHEVPVGTIVRERQVRLVSIEEAFEAAGRLVAALDGEETFESTATMETLITEDLDADISLWAFGLIAAVAPGEDTTPAPGFLLGWHYETPRFGIFADTRFANNESEKRHFQYGTITVGGRYFLLDKAIAPWISGGAAMLFGTTSDAFRQDGTGIGIFGAVGLEMLRFNRNRLALELRLNLPFFRLPYEEYGDVGSGFDNGVSTGPDLYVAPMSLSIAYLRDAPWLSW